MQLDVFFLLLMLLLPLAEAVPLALTGCCSLCNMHLPLVVFMISVRTTTDKHQRLESCSVHLSLKGSCDAISSLAFSLECYKLFVHR